MVFRKGTCDSFLKETEETDDEAEISIHASSQYSQWHAVKAKSIPLQASLFLLSSTLCLSLFRDGIQ